jgi:hypothetical protein
VDIDPDDIVVLERASSSRSSRASSPGEAIFWGVYQR